MTRTRTAFISFLIYYRTFRVKATPERDDKALKSAETLVPIEFRYTRPFPGAIISK